MKGLDTIQNEIAIWHIRNFPKSNAEKMLIGMMEELGELAHANLKGSELNKNLSIEERDALGDIVIFLLEYCNMRNFRFVDILNETWTKVKRRDYTSERKKAANTA